MFQMRSKFKRTATGREFHTGHTFNVKESVCAWIFNLLLSFPCLLETSMGADDGGGMQQELCFVFLKQGLKAQAGFELIE